MEAFKPAFKPARSFARVARLPTSSAKRCLACHVSACAAFLISSTNAFITKTIYIAETRSVIAQRDFKRALQWLDLCVT
jgi:hypothetical protein